MFIPPKCFLCVSSSNTLTNISSYVYGILDTVFWESLADLANHPRFAKLKPSKLVRTINNLLADLFNSPNFLSPNVRKESIRQTFPLYGNCYMQMN